jgi:RHS repeat-associated protein
MRYDYDLLGNRIHQSSMESGRRWTLNDVTGKPIRRWNSRGYDVRTDYDALRRPRRTLVSGIAPATPALEFLTERLVYGEQHPAAEQHGLRGKLFLHLDGAGALFNDEWDFKGNLGQTSRRIAGDYKQTADWTAVDLDHVALPTDPSAKIDPAALETALAAVLAPGTHTTRTEYDALNRPVTVTSPDGSTYRPTFNEANLLNAVDVNLRGAAAAIPFVTNIDYDAKGQRQRISYQNGARTTYAYDPSTFRLTKMRTTRPATADATASQVFADAAVVQDLSYFSDPVGNITRIEDAAPKTVIHGNQQVLPVNGYTYDPLYRLLEATGREHIGQTAFDFNPANGNRRDFPFAGASVHPNDLQALRTYTEQYDYDAAGNLHELRHIAGGGSWTRHFDYEEASLLEPARHSNRLTRTIVGNGVNNTETYTYLDANGVDADGCVTAINLMTMVWDYDDRLQQVDLGGGGTAYYVYDAAGQRVRKVVESQGGTLQNERLYLGDVDIFRDYAAGAVNLQRETLHVTDDTRRIALVETLTIQNGAAVANPTPFQRYQLGNHLGSAAAELADNGALITLEEYHPYGTTSFQVGRDAAELNLKRYRYTTKERDEETGFGYHSARYYAPWLGRWTSCDPSGLDDGPNLFVYVQGNPITKADPTGRQGAFYGPWVKARQTQTAIANLGASLGLASPPPQLTSLHLDIQGQSSKFKVEDMKFGFTDVAKWKTDPEFLTKFKERFVYERREVIKAAAAKFDIPEQLLAGVAYTEIGGKDPIKPAVHWARTYVPFTEDPDKTSLGQFAVQVRRAAESLGYDPKNLSSGQRDAIVDSLKDPVQAVFIAAKHLSDLRDVDFKGKTAKQLTLSDVEVIGARYNQGPEKKIEDVKHDLSYGKSITKRYERLDWLLSHEPAQVEYAPVQNNVVKPLNSAVQQMEREIYKLYGVPYF